MRTPFKVAIGVTIGAVVFTIVAKVSGAVNNGKKLQQAADRKRKN
jgi:hypothetical protein